MGADYNVPDKSESQKLYFFVSRILVAVIVNLVVIPSNQQNPVYYFLHLVFLCPAGSDRMLLKNHYIQIRCLFWSESQIMRL
jgi:hypothetical protein